jgi:hypothetical protein
MKAFSIFLALLSATLCSAAYAAPQVKLESPLNLGDADKEWCHSSPEDSMLLTVTDEGKSPIVLRVCASYGAGKAEVVTDKRGRNYVLFNYGVGRGTNNAVNYYLRVYRLDGNNLLNVMDIPLTWPTSPINRFTYDYSVGTGAPVGLEIKLRALGSDYEPNYVWSGVECCIPTDSTRIIWIDPQK